MKKQYQLDVAWQQDAIQVDTLKLLVSEEKVVLVMNSILMPDEPCHLTAGPFAKAQVLRLASKVLDLVGKQGWVNIEEMEDE